MTIIPSDKMWMVTGDPRSGTSLMMNVMEKLGVPIHGTKYPHAKIVADSLKKMSKEQRKQAAPMLSNKLRAVVDLNPNGFYEDLRVVGMGIRSVKSSAMILGKAVKVVSSGAYPTSGSVGTDWNAIDKVVFCARDPREIVASQMKLTALQMNSVAMSSNRAWAPTPSTASPSQYLGGTGKLLSWIAQNPEQQAKVLVFDYSEWGDKAAAVNKLISFLGISPTQDQITEAVGLVDPKLKRSARESFPADAAQAGKIATDLYTAVIAGNWAGITNLGPGIAAVNQVTTLSGTLWIDDDLTPGLFGTWAVSGPDDYVLLWANAHGCRSSRQKLVVKNQSVRPCRMSCMCPYYSRSQNDVQAIDVPPGLPGIPNSQILTPRVSCGRDKVNKNLLDCYNCWNFGSAKDGEKLPPQNSVG